MVAINLLGVSLSTNQSNRCKLEVDLNQQVEQLKNEAAKSFNQDIQTLDLLYCGNILNCESTLTSCGIKPGVTVHVLKKSPNLQTETPLVAKKHNIQLILPTFRLMKMNPLYRKALLRLTHPQALKTIINANPALAKDTSALALLQDPELLIQLADIQVLRKVAEIHPALINSIREIDDILNEETYVVDPNAPGTSTGYSYSLEALSDDDVEGSESELHTRQGITSAQVSAALANVQNISSGSRSNSSAPVITNEMFTNAMQQAFANVGESNPPAANEQPEEESIDQITRRLTPQLQQMRELGLTNTLINIEALQVTGGDVQMAIDLVFSNALTR